MWLMHICDSGWMSSLIDIWRNCHHAELVFVFVFVFVFMFAVGLHETLLCLDSRLLMWVFMSAGWTVVCGDTQSIRTDQ